MAFKSRLKCLFLKPIFCILFATFLHFACNTTLEVRTIENVTKVNVNQNISFIIFYTTIFFHKLILSFCRTLTKFINSKTKIKTTHIQIEFNQFCMPQSDKTLKLGLILNGFIKDIKSIL